MIPMSARTLRRKHLAHCPSSMGTPFRLSDWIAAILPRFRSTP